MNVKDSRNLDHYWIRNFNQQIPLAHIIRERLKSRWVRIHSLPDAKRYADNENEWEILLHRHNAVVNRLLNNSSSSNNSRSQLAVLTTSWSDLAEIPLAQPSLEAIGLETSHWKSIPDPEDETLNWNLFQSHVEWNPRVLDSLFRLVADDELSNVMVLDSGDSWLIHPYDGGIDLILKSSSERDRIAAEFQDWVSTHQQGF